MDTIQIAVSSQGALALTKLIQLRLEFLNEKDQLSNSEHVEYQALRGVLHQIRNEAEAQAKTTFGRQI